MKLRVNGNDKTTLAAAGPRIFAAVAIRARNGTAVSVPNQKAMERQDLPLIFYRPRESTLKLRGAGPYYEGCRAGCRRLDALFRRRNPRTRPCP